MPSPDDTFSVIHADPHMGIGEHLRGQAEFLDADMHERGDITNPEQSSIQRLSQFGVDAATLAESGIPLDQLSMEQHDKLLAEAIKRYFQTLVAAVYDPHMMSGLLNPADPNSAGPRMEAILEGIEGQKRLGIQAIRHGKQVDPNKTNLVFQLEGMDCIASMPDVQKCFNADIRVFSPQYNQTNQIAENETGLTDLGKQVLHFLFGHGAIIDLAHSSVATRRTILDMAKEKNAGHLISYTHGSTAEFAAETWVARAPERFITEPEVKEILEMGGMIGWGASYPFVPNLERLADLVDSTVQMGGLQQVAIGADFGGVTKPMLLHGLQSVTDLKNLAEALQDRFQYSDEEVRLILQRNGTEWIKNALGRGTEG